MTTYSICISLISGLLLGTIYGLFFVHQRKRVFSLSADIPVYKQYLVIIAATIARLGILIGIWYYILLSPTINFILLISSFLGAFWIIILKQKV